MGILTYEENEKMMLNDVVYQSIMTLKDVNVDKINTDDESKVVFSISNSTLKKFQEYCSKYYAGLEYDIIINNFIEEKIKEREQHHSASLLFCGRKPRRDVILNLKKILEKLSEFNNFPFLTSHSIKIAIQMTLGSADLRTQKKYYESITNFAKSFTDKQKYFRGIFDLSLLREELNLFDI